MNAYLNLGCGYTYSTAAEWTNVDFNARRPFVSGLDLRRSLPFASESFDFVYHSHVLEHIPHGEAHKFLGECWRVLRRRGVLRVVVPDLQAVATQYLNELDAVQRGELSRTDRYRWTLIELMDQMVRESPGGSVRAFCDSASKDGIVYARTRWGRELEWAVGSQANSECERPAWWKLHHRFAGLRGHWRDRLLKMLLREQYTYFEIGRFRASGEVHHWMYDSFSLAMLLAESGFNDVCQRSATESHLSGWARMQLDADADGIARKPDSLFMEALKR